MIDVTLTPIPPSQVDRFTTVLPTCWSPESTAAPTITPEGSIVHPEGSLIYWGDQLVSSQPITSIHQSLCAHILSHCADLIAHANVTVFIEIGDHSQADYYVVVHDYKTIAWIDNHLPESFVVATPAEHEHEYWIHMENFPGPFFSSPEDRQHLVNVMASMAVDASTSDGSTSPMSAEQIGCHLRMLSSFGGDMDEYQTYAIGMFTV
ncbi:hypothetical protein FRC06_009060 [Ceratobasidium sp. 370]|nr:hypothetical protein FRC06_009060 [Ceratobasidium sp. 370]